MAAFTILGLVLPGSVAEWAGLRPVKEAYLAAIEPAPAAAGPTRTSTRAGTAGYTGTIETAAGAKVTAAPGRRPTGLLTGGRWIGVSSRAAGANNAQAATNQVMADTDMASVAVALAAAAELVVSADAEAAGAVRKVANHSGEEQEKSGGPVVPATFGCDPSGVGAWPYPIWPEPPRQPHCDEATWLVTLPMAKSGSLERRARRMRPAQRTQAPALRPA